MERILSHSFSPRKIHFAALFSQLCCLSVCLMMQFLSKIFIEC